MYYIMYILWSFSEGSEQVHADLFIGPTIILIQLVQNPICKGIHRVTCIPPALTFPIPLPSSTIYMVACSGAEFVFFSSLGCNYN